MKRIVSLPITDFTRLPSASQVNWATTMIYAKAHDQTVADDYFAAMQRVERGWRSCR